MQKLVIFTVMFQGRNHSVLTHANVGVDGKFRISSNQYDKLIREVEKRHGLNFSGKCICPGGHGFHV